MWSRRDTSTVHLHRRQDKQQLWVSACSGWTLNSYRWFLAYKCKPPRDPRQQQRGVCWRHIWALYTPLHWNANPCAVIFRNSVPTGSRLRSERRQADLTGPEWEQVCRVDDYTCIILTLQHNRLYGRINPSSRLDFDLTGVWADIHLRKYTQSLSGGTTTEAEKRQGQASAFIWFQLIFTGFIWKNRGRPARKYWRAPVNAAEKEAEVARGGRDGSKATPTIPLGPRQAAQWVPVA